MGSVLAEIIVKNAGDIILANSGYIAEKDVRTVTLTAVVDTGEELVGANGDEALLMAL